MKIVISGPAAAENNKTSEPITDPDELRKLDGVAYDADVCSNYLHGKLEEIGLIGGSLRIAYDAEAGGLRVITEYHSPRALKPAELQALADDTLAQWSDGIGEGAFDQYAEETGIWINPFPIVSDRDMRVEQVDDGVKVARKRQSPLLKAAESGDVEKLRKLLAKGEDINARSRHGLTSVQTALLSRQPDAALFLVEAGADLAVRDSDENSLLGLACMTGAGAVARALIERGADVNSRDDRGATPLMWAANRKFPELAELLLDHGADPNLQDSQQGSTALMYLPERSGVSLELTELLMRRGADPALRNHAGQTAAEAQEAQLAARLDGAWSYLVSDEEAATAREFIALLRSREG